LEEWKNRNGYYPTEIYLQADGGCENANKYLLALLELLVTKKMARVIFYTRLPVGHTHEDIDAAFATVWRCWFCFQACETFKMYQDGNY
jgi:hypothetical protein